MLLIKDNVRAEGDKRVETSIHTRPEQVVTWSELQQNLIAGPP